MRSFRGGAQRGAPLPINQRSTLQHAAFPPLAPAANVCNVSWKWCSPFLLKYGMQFLKPYLRLTWRALAFTLRTTRNKHQETTALSTKEAAVSLQQQGFPLLPLPLKPPSFRSGCVLAHGFEPHLAVMRWSSCSSDWPSSPWARRRSPALPLSGRG